MESTKREAKWKNGVLPRIIVSATWYSSAWSWQLTLGRTCFFNYIFYHKESWSWVIPKILRRFSAILISSFLYICYMQYSKTASKTDLYLSATSWGKTSFTSLVRSLNTYRILFHRAKTTILIRGPYTHAFKTIFLLPL